MGAFYSQIIPPSPTLTEANLPSQKGKVFIVTGGYGGVGLALSTILFDAGAKVYLAGRSVQSGQRAVADLRARQRQQQRQQQQQSNGGSSGGGEVEFLHIDLSDLASVRAAADAFKSVEGKLDVLWQNAGLFAPAYGSVGAQGHELQLSTNALGPFLLYQLLLPCLERAAAAEGAALGATRVVWAGSIAVDAGSLIGGFGMAQLDKPGRNLYEQGFNYAVSKTANWYLAHAIARQPGGARDKGILHVAQNPGNLRTGLLRDNSLVSWLVWPALYDARYGAYTELWSGLSGELTMEDGGAYILPWGRRHPSPSPVLLKTLQGKEEGGTGLAQELYEWCWEQVKDYL